MHTTPSILTALVILLATGCAAVDPNPTGEAGYALIDGQDVTAAGIPTRVQLNGGEFWQQVRGDFRLSDTRHDAVSKRAALYAQNAWQVERILKRG